MTKSRSLSQHIFGFKMLFGFLLLFTTGNLVGGQSSENVISTISTITSAPPRRTTGSLVSEHEPIPSATSVSIITQEHTSAKETSVATVLHNAISPTQDESPETEAAILQKPDRTVGQENVSVVLPDFQATVGKSQPRSTKDLGKGTQGGFSAPTPPWSVRPRKEVRETTTETRDPQDVAQTQMSGNHTLGPFRETPKDGPSDPRTSEKNHIAIILAIVFSALLVVVLIVVLYCRRRRHSGSTSFNAPQWAGQAALPDDPGLDKDFEQEAGAEGEGPTRRGTLVTFFGKRQSRVPSVAMEDINGKGERGETEQLLGGEAGQSSVPERSSGDANGKIAEPTVESSQESPTSNQTQRRSS